MSNNTEKKKKEYLFILSFAAYPILLFIVFYVCVNLNSILLAFQNVTITGEKSFAGIKNFKSFISDITKDPLIYTSILNSLKIYFFGLIISLPLTILFSYYLYKKFFGHRAVRFVVLLPQIISSFVVCLVFKKFVESALPNIMHEVFGFREFPNLITDRRYAFKTNVFYGIWVSFAGGLIMYPNAMNEIPEEIIESAMVDGIDNMFQELRYMILPLIFPTLSTFLITGVAGIFTSDNNLIAFFMYDASANLYNMGYYFTVNVMTGGNSVYPYLSAAGLTLTLIIAPVTYLVKYLLEKFGPVTEY